MSLRLLILLILCSCSYGIKEQRELANYSHRAKDICKKNKKKCEDAKVCIKAANEGIYTIQQSQENKLHNISTSVDEPNSIISYKKAVEKCQQF